MQKSYFLLSQKSEQLINLIGSFLKDYHKIIGKTFIYGGNVSYVNDCYRTIWRLLAKT